MLELLPNCSEAKPGQVVPGKLDHKKLQNSPDVVQHVFHLLPQRAIKRGDEVAPMHSF